MANAVEVKKYTGFSIGGVSPVGHLEKMDILIDKSFSRFDNVYAAAGHPNCVFKINYEKLIKITNVRATEMWIIIVIGLTLKNMQVFFTQDIQE